jgi:hypothetical protein
MNGRNLPVTDEKKPAQQGGDEPVPEGGLRYGYDPSGNLFVDIGDGKGATIVDTISDSRVSFRRKRNSPRKSFNSLRRRRFFGRNTWNWNLSLT